MVKPGLIPAHAGKTCLAGLVGTHTKAHPRSRGENAWLTSVGPAAGGSSPLTRGKHRRLDSNLRLDRLIPAHAGKTSGCPSTRSGYRAHPRSRGENTVRLRVDWVRRGSSPLTRGKHGLLVHAGHVRGLIPAHAGKTPAGKAFACPTWAHPRSRGENRRPTAAWRSTVGSSPLTRGKRHEDGPRELLGGLIPAHAGKTTTRRYSPDRSPAHPRSRGENFTTRRETTAVVGSSPLTRGKPDRRLVQ